MRVVDGLRNEIRDLPRGAVREIPDVVFILAGYSWRQKRFRIYLVKWDKNANAVADATTPLVAFAGDEVGKARKRLFALLRSKGKLPLRSLDFNHSKSFAT
jgi:hypothetical protein